MTETSAVYQAKADGTYTFYSQAVDYVGNMQESFVYASVSVQTAAPPTVTNVLVDSSSWTATYLDYLQAQGLGNGAGYSIPVGSSAQFTTLPWANLNQVQIVFSENVSITASDLVVAGVNNATYTASGFTYDDTTFTATWTFTNPLPDDRLLLEVDGLIHRASIPTACTWTERGRMGKARTPRATTRRGRISTSSSTYCRETSTRATASTRPITCRRATQLNDTVSTAGYNFRYDVLGQGTITRE